MRAFVSKLSATLAAILVVNVPTAAHAGDEEWVITSYEVDALVHQDGLIDVTIDMTFDFGDEEAHGPFVTLVEKQRIANDPDHYRVLEYSDITATSSTGAPANVQLEDEGVYLAVKVGDPDKKETVGEQQYTISYTVAGVPSPAVGAQGADEVYWNVIGAGWEVPIKNADVQVSGPAAVVAAACYRGVVTSAEQCHGINAGGVIVTFTEPVLEPGDAMTIAVQYPSGTFDELVAPILTERTTFANFMGIGTPAPWAAIGLAALGVIAVIWRGRQRGRDRTYLGLTPGLAPTSTDSAAEGYASSQTVAVQFTPPDGVTPGAAGTLLDEYAHRQDVTATIVDLAVRGYLTIEETEDEEGGDSWILRRIVTGPQSDWSDLLPFEQTILGGLFPPPSTSVSIHELDSGFNVAVWEAQQQLYDRVVERGWFSKSPQKVRNSWYGRGFLVFFLGVAALVLLGLFTGWGFIGAGVMVIGIGIIIGARFAPARTADGTAVLAQVLGFKQYLETAEADQLRFDEGEDIFSRYLPYAIAFGVVEHWAGVFADAVARGQTQWNGSWYTGSDSAAFDVAVFSSITSFSSSANSAVTAATSGGSGTSGGFSGGGVGGGGGGGW